MMDTNQDFPRRGSNDFNNQSRERERLLQKYLDALDAGDVDAQITVMKLGSTILGFDEAVWDLHLTLADEAESTEAETVIAARTAEDAHVRDLATITLSAPVAGTRAEAQALARQIDEADAFAEADPEAELPQLTLRDVAFRLRQNVEQGLVAARDRAVALRAATTVEQASSNAPFTEEYLARRNARTLLNRIGLAGAGAWFEKLFHDAVVDLHMTREQDAFRLAAARRTSAVKRQAQRYFPSASTPTTSTADDIRGQHKEEDRQNVE